MNAIGHTHPQTSVNLTQRVAIQNNRTLTQQREEERAQQDSQGPQSNEDQSRKRIQEIRKADANF